MTNSSHRYLKFFAFFFITITAIFALLTEWAGRSTGTTLSPRRLAETQSVDRKAITFNEQIPLWGAMKLARIAAIQPEVIFIGSSRGNALREEMFKPYKFYNASLTAWTIDQTRQMLERVLRVSSPRVVVIALDYWMFTNQWSSIEQTRTMKYDSWLAYEMRTSRTLLETLARAPALIQTKVIPAMKGDHLLGRGGLNFLGIDAMRYETGFRPDGSYLYPVNYRAGDDSDKNFFATVLKAFPGGRRYDDKQANALEHLSALAKSRNVQLIAIQLPIAPAARKYLDTEKSYHRLAGLWRESQSEERRDMLAEMDIPFYDLSRQLDDNTDFLDAAHPTEKAMIKVLLKLSEQADFHKVLPLIETQRIRDDMAHIPDPGAIAVYPTQ